VSRWWAVVFIEDTQDDGLRTSLRTRRRPAMIALERQEREATYNVTGEVIPLSEIGPISR
jgi:hypothetical protein